MDAVFKARDKKEAGADLLNQLLTHLLELNSFQVNELVQKKWSFQKMRRKILSFVIVKEITFYGHFFVVNQYLHKTYLVRQVSTLKFRTVYQY